MSRPKRSVKITDRLTCFSPKVICITCTLCKKIYIGETGRKRTDRFREHVCDVEKNDKDGSKPVERHFNLSNYATHNMTISGLSLHQENTESHKNLEQKFVFQLGTINPGHVESMNASHSTSLFIHSSPYHNFTNETAPPLPT